MYLSFRGGIHPPENKAATRDLEFVNLPVPHTCYIPLQQHIGAPATPVVQVGDGVFEGQLIGAAEGFVSANVHSSIPGKVTDIAPVLTVYGMQPTVVVEAEGSFSSSAGGQEAVEWTGFGGDDLRRMIRDAGIVGLGGAAFPTSVKLSPPAEKHIDTLVINGAECEPYLTVDDMLMKTFPSAVIEGVRITMKALGIEKAIIGIEANKPEAFRALKESIAAAEPSGRIRIKKLPTKYPQGAEKQMIYALLRRPVPSGGLPMDVGVIVQNVGTVYAIRDAVAFGRPLFSRFITVGGGAIAKPGNYKVRIGMRISDIVEECGGFTEQPARIVIGGPMCGMSVHSMDIPVVKGTSGILFLTEKDVSLSDYQPCIRCKKCVLACPIGLLPNDLGTSIEKGRLDLTAELNPFDCIMCGSCSYVCPAHRPLTHFIKLGQQRLRAKK
ncbi:MAG: electron transport complex subunit RsxC [Chrysiogenales bacterium]|nr:MAG: electron transport complex subunit RsxC [Chrysiogenales bacterium]